MSCDNVPTTSEIEQAKKDIDDFNTFMTSTSDTFIDSKGVSRSTLDGTIKKIDWSYVGLFADGVTFTKKSDFAIDANGTQWIYTGNYPFSATAGTVPSEPTYQVVHVKSASAISNANGGSVQDFIDSQAFASLDDMVAFNGHADGNVVKVVDDFLATYYTIVSGSGDIDLGGGLFANVTSSYSRKYERTAINDMSIVKYEIEQAAATPLIFAHRGLNTGASNTVRQFSYAIQSGCDGIEIDIRMTSDGVPVVYHDDNLDTITSGTGAIKDNTLSQVQAAVFNVNVGTVFAGERIPKLQDVLNLVKDTGVKCIYEVKDYRTLDDVDAYVQLAIDSGVADNLLFSSFTLSEVQRMVDYKRDIDVLHYVTVPTIAAYDALAAVDNTKKKVLAGQYPNLNKALVDYGKSLGIATAAWTFTNSEDVRKLKRMGVNMFVSDKIIGDLK